MQNRIITRGEPDPYDLCPCGSGIKGKFCCWTSRHWFKPPTRPTAKQTTGISNKNCLARCLNDCSQIISGEHVVPRSVLALSSQEAISIRNFAWAESKTVGIDSLVANVTCTAHNNAASPYDAAVTKTFQTLLEFGTSPFDDQSSTMKLVSGPDLERGLLKILLAAVAAGWIKGRTGKIQIKDALPELAEMMFGQRSMADYPGLYLCRPHTPLQFSGNLTFECLFTKPNHVTGLLLEFAGATIALGLAKIGLEGPLGESIEELYRRPAGLIFSSGSCQKSLVISWPDEYRVAEDDFVHLDPSSR